MSCLIRIGYWHSPQHPELPRPDRMVDPSRAQDEQDLVGGYLRCGLPVIHMMGHSPCRLCGLAANGTSELTDGKYRWPEGLAHYGTGHSVRLPAEFFEHVSARFHALEAAALRAHEEGLDDWLNMTR